MVQTPVIPYLTLKADLGSPQAENDIFQIWIIYAFIKY